MSHRVIRALEWARPVARPICIPKRRPRGAKGLGLRYERELGKALGPGWQAGQWFEFMDQNGHGYCQVDFLQRTSFGTAVLEAKLTWLPEAHLQLEQLYRPVVERCWGLPMVGVVVAKRLVPGTKAAIAQTLPSALEAARSCRAVVLHWSGKAALWPGPRITAPPFLPLSPSPAPATLP